jgi:hypothetical protein
MIKSDLEVNVSTGQGSNNCWIVLGLVHMNKVKRERSTEQRSSKNSCVKLQMNNIKVIEKLAKEYACINSSPLLSFNNKK